MSVHEQKRHRRTKTLSLQETHSALYKRTSNSSQGECAWGAPASGIRALLATAPDAVLPRARRFRYSVAEITQNTRFGSQQNGSGGLAPIRLVCRIRTLYQKTNVHVSTGPPPISRFSQGILFYANPEGRLESCAVSGSRIPFTRSFHRASFGSTSEPWA